jgi:uncharacterized protein YbjT (DUF2867 family)
VAVLLCSINRKNERREASDDATFAGAARDRDGRPMKLSVLGAAGATGIPLVEQALAAGHRVTALVRSGPKTDDHQSQPPCCRRRRNRPRSGLRGHERRRRCHQRPRRERTGDDRGDARHRGRGQTEGPERVVMLSSFVAARDRLTPVTRVVTGIAMSSQIKDKTAGEEILRASGLDWTIVYPTKLTNGPKTEARVVPERRRSGRRRKSRAREWPRSSCKRPRMTSTAAAASSSPDDAAVRQIGITSFECATRPAGRCGPRGIQDQASALRAASRPS